MSRSDSANAWRMPAADRLLAFLDASVAIALTLMVLPLTELVPEATSEGQSASTIITGNLETIGAFLLSFVVIWRFWSVHHRLFAWAGAVTRLLMGLNLIWLLSIVVIPFLTEMVSAFGNDAFVVRLYVGVLTVCSLTLTTMTLVMRRDARRESAQGPPDVFVDGAVAATAGFVLVLLIVLALPAAGYWPLLLLLVIDTPLTWVAARVRERFATAS